MTHRIYRDDELFHHGILGMRWGIRRYQNEDGTLTEAGKQRYRTDKKFAKKYDEDSAKRRKIENINKKQAGNYNYASQERADVNNKHHNVLSTATMTYGDEFNYRLATSMARKKSTKGIYDTGRVALNASLNYIYKKKYEQIAQEYALKEYNDDGTRRIRYGSKEHEKLIKERKRKQSVAYLTATALKVISNIGLTKLSNTDFGDTFNRGPRHKYDVDGKWASRPSQSFTYKIG